MEQNQATNPETSQQLVRYRLTTPKGEPVLEVSGSGAFFWNPEAPKLIADNEQWPAEFTGIRFVLQALWNIEIEPLNARDAFGELKIAMPDHVVEGTPEWDTELKFQIYRAGIAYGRRYLLELSGPEFAALSPTFAALIVNLNQIGIARNAGQAIGEEAWKQVDELVAQGVRLMPTLQRLGKDCEHELVLAENQATQEKVMVCVYCRETFQLYKAPDQTQESEIDAEAGQESVLLHHADGEVGETAFVAKNEQAPADPPPTTES